ncbi:MAG TPA: tRNA (N6-isopentenyl adenosine(37)-C2)-methylthiotransferase MiaB [Luteibaculaceae bacterium]|nr:tRNA (N6-isopentenyl adenosine(37)-C2)-methylthiotransferase MiaB [Luteibaculaceae bacterium]
MMEGEKTIDESKQGEALVHSAEPTNGKKIYLESYGCQMNFSDSEIVASVMIKEGYGTTRNAEEASIILINTCAIRDKAEERIRGRLDHFKTIKKKNPDLIVGIMGCMAERLKADLLEEEKLVDIVVGPDSYRDLPSLVNRVEEGHKAVNVLLSREETYADITPVKLDTNGITAFISIMRGCDNMCSFCVVPFTRGRERSRDPESIVAEAKNLFEQGYREVTLLGQNVDSYKWNITSKGEIVDPAKPTVNFAQLLEKVALVSPLLRVRFSTSHPKDMTDEVLQTIAQYENICNYIHLPVQSGSSEVLHKMNRNYTREWYLDRIKAIQTIIPDCLISTDVITGFCGETEEQHRETLSLMEEVKFGFAYMYCYSERPKTLAERKYEDDIPEEVKKRRLTEIVDLQREHGLYRNREMIGKTFEVLIEGVSKRSDEYHQGRNSQNCVVVFPKGDSAFGTYRKVKVNDCTSATLIGELVD